MIKTIFISFKDTVKRLYIYQKEMLPFWKNLIMSVVLFFEIYFFVVLTSGIMFRIGVAEVVGCYTIFTFFLSLRIADDLKDIQTDLKLFAHRPIPSGRVKKKDIIILLIISNAVAIALNIIFMRDNPLYFIFYAVLIGYGVLMSVWFFARSKIQPNLVLALITHNPIGVIINMYIIGFTCLKYSLPIFTVSNALLALTLYWPTLVWEMARKVRAPKDETEYVTYSKLYGYKKMTMVILAIITVDLVTSFLLMYGLWRYGVIAVVAAYVWFMAMCIMFFKNPEKFKLVRKVEIYEFITEVPVILIQIGLILYNFAL